MRVGRRLLAHGPHPPPAAWASRRTRADLRASTPAAPPLDETQHDRDFELMDR